MKVKFWGCRGSLPASVTSGNIEYKVRYALEKAIQLGIQSTAALDEFIRDLPFHVRSTYGNNTPCVEILGGNEIIVCDAGSGLRDLGRSLVSKPSTGPRVINILVSHLHWDHIQGFPFFIPAYMQGTLIRIWGCHDELESAFINQQNPPCFPVLLEDMGANISFHQLDLHAPNQIGGITVTAIEQPHPGLTYGYCFQKDGQKIVYSTDIEHQDEVEDPENNYTRFYRDADILIMDCQFNLADHLYTKQNWGHSSNLIAIELGVISRVKTLCLFHADPFLDDFQLDKFIQDSLRYHQIYAPDSDMKILLAHDGLEL